MGKHGMNYRNVKKWLISKFPKYRFKSRELAPIISEMGGYHVSSLAVSMCLTKFKENGILKRIDISMDSDDWEIQEKIVMLQEAPQ